MKFIDRQNNNRVVDALYLDEAATTALELTDFLGCVAVGWIRTRTYLQITLHDASTLRVPWNRYLIKHPGGNLTHLPPCDFSERYIAEPLFSSHPWITATTADVDHSAHFSRLLKTAAQSWSLPTRDQWLATRASDLRRAIGNKVQEDQYDDAVKLIGQLKLVKRILDSSTSAPVTNPSRTCIGCKHVSCAIYHEPCSSCVGHLHKPNFQPKHA